MNIIFNEKPLSIEPGTTLSSLLATQGITPRGIATAVNDKVVAKDKRSQYVLSENDNVLVISAFYGG